MSRLNLREHFVIDHQVEVSIFGELSPQSAIQLYYQFRDANRMQRSSVAPSRPTAGPSTVTDSRRGVTRRQDDGDEEEDEEDEDEEVIKFALRVRALNDENKARQVLANLKKRDDDNDEDMYPRVIAYLRRTAKGGR